MKMGSREDAKKDYSRGDAEIAIGLSFFFPRSG
jgi:hypothetical protein